MRVDDEVIPTSLNEGNNQEDIFDSSKYEQHLIQDDMLNLPQFESDKLKDIAKLAIIKSSRGA